MNGPHVTLATALYKWGACACLLCATPILSDIQQTTVDPPHTLSTILKHDPTPTSPKGQNSQQLKRRSSSTSAADASPVAKAKRQMTSRSSSTSSNPQTPLTSPPTKSDGHRLRSRTSSFSNDHTASNDPVKVCTCTMYTWQKLTKDPKSSQRFHSPPLIQVLKATKSETTAHISQDTRNKLHIAHMCWDDYSSSYQGFFFFFPK